MRRLIVTEWMAGRRRAEPDGAPLNFPIEVREVMRSPIEGM